MSSMANRSSVDPYFSFLTSYLFLGALRSLDWPQFISSSESYVELMAILGPHMIRDIIEWDTICSSPKNPYTIWISQKVGMYE